MKGWIYSLAIWLLSCTSVSEGGHPSAARPDTAISASVVKVNESANAAAAPLSLEPFTELPQSIKGCSAVYANDMDALASRSYVFVTDLKEKAYIRIAGRFIPLKLDNKLDDGSLIKEIYKGAGYTVHVVTHKVKKTGDEVWLYTGQVLILKNGEQESAPIVGEVGC